MLREANRNTLKEVGAFVRDAPAKAGDKIPAAYIITGPNTASQRLLFEQLADSLADLARPARFVSVRSEEARDLKGTLKKIVRDATARGGDEDEEVAVGRDGRKYLDYDLEALHAFMKLHGSRRVFVAFQDTEAFDTALLSDLISLLNSWRDRLQFTLLFGIATSVELFQVRLLKSTAQHLYGAQFDVVQASSVLESVFMAGIAHYNVALRLGPSLLRGLIERQQEQVAGVQGFISSLKYAYMCHFYADPLSVLLVAKYKTELIQPEHLEAVRMLDSFKIHVEAAVDAGRLTHAQNLIEVDDALTSTLLEELEKRREYSLRLLRSLHLLKSADIPVGNFIDLYTSALADGIDLAADGSTFLDSVRRLQPEEIISLISRVLGAVREGNPELGLDGWAKEAEDMVVSLMEMGDEIISLLARAKEEGSNLRSKYSAQSRVLRTTVVAQKVQLSQDTAKLTAEDKAFTDAIDRLVDLLSGAISCESLDSQLFHEIWVYDSKSPNRDVFIPRPGTSIERALSRPHDYLACTCCSKADGEMAGSLPATAILYHLYIEAGALVNVADLWSAFYTLVGGEEDEEGGLDEREALVRFYQALAELKTMGFVKQSKKKADHIAKLKWM
jgi:origin recognition complex subunit 3